MFDIAWRDQNVVAEKAVKRRKNANEKAHREHTTARGGQVGELSRSPPSISPSLSQNYEDYALDFFFSKYIFPPRDHGVPRGFLEFLYPVWTQADATSPLWPATTAVASCMLEAWSKLQPDLPLTLSRSQYLKGVAAVRKSLQGSEDVGDDVLMAAQMLNFYENLRSFWTTEPNTSPHVSGSAALVEYRRRQPFASELSQRVLLGIRVQIVAKALRNKEPISANVAAWSNIARDVPPTPATSLDDLNVELANIQAAAAQLDSGVASQGDGLTVLEILKKALDLDQRFAHWTATLPDDWQPIRVSGFDCISQSIRDAGLYQDHCDIYKSIYVAGTFNAHSASRIRLQQTILACLAHLQTSTATFDSASPVMVALDIIQELADNICASIPHHLGDRTTTNRIDDRTCQYPHVRGCPVPDDHYEAAAAMGGWYVATRLLELLSPNVPLRTGQQQWIGSQLRRLGKIYNIRSN